jgi:hypothetical protein
MYLWRRGFGTSAYRAGGLTRWLDTKVARHIGFEGARANYAPLQELPERLREHADLVTGEADAALAALAALDEAGRREDGIPALVDARDRAAQALAQVDAQLDARAMPARERTRNSTG